MAIALVVQVKHFVGILGEVFLDDGSHLARIEVGRSNEVSLVSNGLFLQREHVELGNISDIDGQRADLGGCSILVGQFRNVHNVLVRGVERLVDGNIKQLRTQHKRRVDSGKTESRFFILEEFSCRLFSRDLGHNVRSSLTVDVVPGHWIPRVLGVNVGVQLVADLFHRSKRGRDHKVGDLRGVLLGGFEDVERAIDGRSQTNNTVQIVRVVGLVAHDHAGPLLNGIDNLGRNHDARQRNNSRADGLSKCQQVRPARGESEFGVHEGVWVAASAQTAHDLVQDQQSAVFFANSFGSVQIALWWDAITDRGAAHGLHKHTGNLLWPVIDKSLLQVVQQHFTVLFLGHAWFHVSVRHESRDLRDLVVRKQHFL
ncbi:hypothetical protein OGATHE_004161 [Ogataea polymorpha]|uniref:Uncharacterized protein n=1 Tax=Ogataea polymorpha TaxID=460523 RepID=A0A9P8T4R4_9ASCO|nr:hypothetical protein OGATHE_004161 [Ogataea polymorpha]